MNDIVGGLLQQGDQKSELQKAIAMGSYRFLLAVASSVLGDIVAQQCSRDGTETGLEREQNWIPTIQAFKQLSVVNLSQGNLRRLS